MSEVGMSRCTRLSAATPVAVGLVGFLSAGVWLPLTLGGAGLGGLVAQGVHSRRCQGCATPQGPSVP